MNNQITAQDLKTDNDSLSYAYGIFIASQLQGQNIKNIDSKIFTSAISSQLEGEETLMSMDEAKMIIGQMQQKQQASVGIENKMAGEKFLAENKKRSGVVTTESGLQYEVLKEGTGAIPTSTSTVNTHYHGTLITGEVFDSSVERGEPISFPVNGVIKGWTEALQLMKVGSKYKLYIPSELAYGPRGAGASIGPNSTLIFEVELLGIDK